MLFAIARPMKALGGGASEWSLVRPGILGKKSEIHHVPDGFQDADESVTIIAIYRRIEDRPYQGPLLARAGQY